MCQSSDRMMSGIVLAGLPRTGAIAVPATLSTIKNGSMAVVAVYVRILTIPHKMNCNRSLPTAVLCLSSTSHQNVKGQQFDGVQKYGIKSDDGANARLIDRKLQQTLAFSD